MNAPTSDKCFACQCDSQGPLALKSTAFLAGIAFALQHNAEAIASRLCQHHREALRRGHERTKGIVKPGSKRTI